MREEWTEVHVSQPVWLSNLLEYGWGFAAIEAQQ